MSKLQEITKDGSQMEVTMDKSFLKEFAELKAENERLKKENKLIRQMHNDLSDKLFEFQKIEDILQEIKEIATALYMNEWLQQNETARKSIQLLQEKIAECEVE